MHTQGVGLGDDIVIARFVRDLVAACGLLGFEIACNNETRSRWVYESVQGFRGCRSAFAFREIAGLYTLALRINQIIEVAAEGKVVPAKLAIVRESLSAFAAENTLLMQGLPYTSGDLARRAVFANATRATFLHAQAGIAYGGPRLPLAVKKDVIERFGLAGRDFITFHNGFDPAFIVSARYSTKSYRRFDEVVTRVTTAIPGVSIVQVGITETSTILPSVHINLVGKTTLPEVAAVIAKSRLHVDIDSGLVHIAAAMGVPAVVLFGPSDADYFGYPDNINLRPQFCGGCWWINEAWMDQCPRHFNEPRCMATHSPDEVAARITAALAGPDVIWAPRRSTAMLTRLRSMSDLA